MSGWIPGRTLDTIMKILIAYDGSADAKAAVALAGHLFDRSTAVVLTVWEGFSTVVARAQAGGASTFDFEQIDAQCEQWARERAIEGAGHARAAGLQAEARAAHRRQSIADTILAEATTAGAELVVLGTRGLTGVRSLLLGSVSRAVLQHSGLPVLVAPATARETETPPAGEPFLSAKL
ncbi:MAG: universal stress protein [Solirubrobacteraceae bacterium]